MNIKEKHLRQELLDSFLLLGATAQGELWPPEQCASILLCSSTFLPILSLSFYGDHHVPTSSLMSICVSFTRG
jgi:hypothetical protein